MTVGDVISYARFGELSQLAVRNNVEAIVTYINMALVTIYGRFNIKTEEAILSLKSGKTLYLLDGTDADVTVAGVVMPANDVMVIVEAFDEYGRIPLNAEDDEFSIHTPSYNSVQVPLTEDDTYISIIYKQNPTKIVYLDDITTLTNIVPLPDLMLEPLLHYIGYRAHGAVDGKIQSENNTHYMRFEASCKRIDALGLIASDDLNRSNSKKGFLV